MTKSKFIGKASEGMRILNDNIKGDFIRLLEIVADVKEADFEEVERLANKYRIYFDEQGKAKELA